MQRVKQGNDSAGLLVWAVFGNAAGFSGVAEGRDVDCDCMEAGISESRYGLAPYFAPGSSSVNQNDRTARGWASLLKIDFCVVRGDEMPGCWRGFGGGLRFATMIQPAKKREDQAHKRDKRGCNAERPSQQSAHF
jgi:hypothetical protein